MGFMSQAPVALDIRSPMDLVYECFVKLGLRYICVLRDGRYAGMVSTLSLDCSRIVAWSSGGGC
jgi:chloride channel 3/4/5